MAAAGVGTPDGCGHGDSVGEKCSLAFTAVQHGTPESFFVLLREFLVVTTHRRASELV